MGYGGSGNPHETVFVGRMDTCEAEYSMGKASSVTIHAYGLLHDMMNGTNSRSWTDTPIKTVVNDVVSNYFKSVRIEGGKTQLSRKFQDQQSDYQFVTDLAEKYGFDCYTVLDELYFVPSNRDTANQNPVSSLFFGETLERFSVQTERKAIKEVEVRHWNESTNKEIVATATVNSEESGKEVHRTPVESKKEAEKIAQSKANRRSITATAESFGIANVVAGKTIKVDGIDDKFAGQYYVTRATHRINNSGYNMSLELEQR
jgi:phage protein D